MSIEHTLTLNLSTYVPPPVLYMPQGDSGSRVIKAELWNGSEAYTIPSGSIAMVRFGKPDGTGGLYDETETGEAVTYSENVVTAPVVAQMLSVAGYVKAQIDIYQASDSSSQASKLASFVFQIYVEKSAYSDDTVISSDYYNVLSANIQKAFLIAAHAPIIGANGNWLLWDSDSEEYEDSGEASKGSNGLHGTDLNVYISEVAVSTDRPAGGTLVEIAETRYLSGGATSTKNKYFYVLNGKDGKSAFESAQDGGYTGEETEFNSRLASAISKASYPVVVTATLRVANWNETTKSMTINLAGATASGAVFVSPSPGSFEEYCAAGVRCTSFSGSALAFKCDVIPTVNLVVNVAIFGGSGMTIFNSGGMINSGE